MIKQFDMYKKKLNAFKYVSFDLFDTLVFRLVNTPNDVFEYIEKEIMCNNVNKKNNISDFQRKRIRAEQLARSKKTSEDVCLLDIYACFNGITDAEKDELMQLERSAEVYLSYPNKPMIDTLNWCREQGKIVIITTDMYLDRDTIIKILIKNKIAYDTLYISGEIGKTKSSGNLFSHILSDMSVLKEDIVHIGDNRINDYERPLEIGISAILFEEKKKVIPFLETYRTTNSIINSVLINWLLRDVQYKNAGQEIGYCALGPSLVEFCKFIHDKKRIEKLDKLWFIAREGYFIHRLYVLLYPEEKRSCCYVQLNKNLLRKPFIENEPTIEMFLMTAPSYDAFSFEDIFALLDIKNTVKTRKNGYIEGISLNRKYTREEMLTNPTFQKAWKQVMKACATSLRGQSTLLDEYMKSIYSCGEKIGLVNNSINGSIQMLFEKYLNARKAGGYIVGIQFISSVQCRQKGLHIHAWLEEENFKKYDIEHFNRTCLMFEHLLFEPVGTALKLEKSAGELKIVTDELGLEERNVQTIENVQTSAIEYAITYNKLKLNTLLRKILAQLYSDFIKNPSKEEVAVIAKLYNRDISGEHKLLPDDDDIHNCLKLLKRSRENDVAWPVGYIVLHRGSKWLVKLHNMIIRIKSMNRRL